MAEAASSTVAPLDSQGLPRAVKLHKNLAPAVLTELALARGEGLLTELGALSVSTGKRTGRSPKDRFIIAEPGVNDQIWWGPINHPMAPDVFNRLLRKAWDYAARQELFVFDGWGGADPRYRLPVRVITQKAWHSLFAHTLFRRPTADELRGFRPGFTVLALDELKADPATDGTRSEVCIALALEQRVILILGTSYAGEIKKSIFSVLNYLLPQQGVLPMHCSANIGPTGDTALFFGLSGTGKTTLSADPQRHLIGDDEHGWSDMGVFNFEGGCYAKTVRLSPQGEPQIWNAIRFGSVLENVVVNPASREPDYDDTTLTENTRCTYPVEYIENCELSGMGGHPANIVFLTCDAFGVLPPLSRLTQDQAVQQFLSGYTAKIAGTEAGITEPEATFSPCFGGPFLPRQPQSYAAMLKEKLEQHGSQVWLVNTGWSGGPAGRAHRIKLTYTRAMLHAALSGDLLRVPYQTEPVFGLAVPIACKGVPADMLLPRTAWKDAQQYDSRAHELAERFRRNLDTYLMNASAEG